MAEPHATGWAAWWAGGAALMAGFLGAVGITWVHVLLAAGGAYFGAGMAPRVGWPRAAISFVLVSILGAKVGVLIGIWHGPWGAVPAAEVGHGACILAGLLFHPVVTVLVRAVPARVERTIAPPAPPAQQSGDAP